MTTYWLSPVFLDASFADNNGAPLSGGLLYSYVAGSTTVEQTTYANKTGTPNTNPVVLNSAGRLTTGLWLDSSLAYQFVLKSADGITLCVIDNVTGVPVLASSGSSNVIWNTLTATPSYVSTNQFLVPGDFVVQFAVGNRAQILNSGGSYQYGTVTASAFSAGNTVVTLAVDSGNLNSTISAVAWSDLVAAGPTVDAGGVSYSTLPYTTTGTVGYELNQLLNQVGVLTADATIRHTLWQASGSPNYTITATPAVTSYTNLQLNIQFLQASTGVPATLNVNGAGAARIYQWGPAGLQDPHIFANQTSIVVYDGSWILQGAAQYPASTGALTTTYTSQSFVTNATYTLPANCVGVYVYSNVYGGSNAGATAAISVYNSSNALLGTIPYSGTNVSNGNDGGSGMADTAGSLIPIPAGAAYIKFISLPGSARTPSSFVLYATVTQA